MNPRSRRIAIIIAAVALLAAIVLLLGRCQRPAPAAAVQAPPPEARKPAGAIAAAAGGPQPGAPLAAEVLSPATIVAPAQAVAGASIALQWTGPDNPGDYITVVDPGAAAETYGNYVETRCGRALELPMPVQAGPYEIRYVAARSKTVLGRTAITVLPAAVALEAPAQVTAGAPLRVGWTGPNNPGDYVTIVPSGAPDGQYQSYADVAKGSPAALTAPVEAGAAELRYVTGREHRVLARRPITVVAATVTLDAVAEAVAGSRVSITWTGPANKGDYLTIVPKTTRDGEYARYTDTHKGSPLSVEAPLKVGPAEIRYMTGQGAKVLARRPLMIVPAPVAGAGM